MTLNPTALHVGAERQSSMSNMSSRHALIKDKAMEERLGALFTERGRC